MRLALLTLALFGLKASTALIAVLHALGLYGLSLPILKLSSRLAAYAVRHASNRP